jgi:antitoxin (DNA-binding transcriptional repressor) of toxin-antitoxin stability system
MHDLKKELASVIAEAATRAKILITRHNKAVVRLTGPGSQHLNKGSLFGKANLKPAVRGNTAGHYLQLLQEDRHSGRH